MVTNLNWKVLKEWIQKPEDRNLEFKKAENSFSKADIYKYSSALSNEWWGYLIFWVDDKSREIVWSKAFLWTHTSLSNDIAVNVWWIRVDVEEFFLEDKRLLVFIIPSRPTWTAIKYDKIAWVRYGESCKDMSDSEYRRIIDEIQIDETSRIIEWITITDFDKEALEILKKLWGQEASKIEYETFDDIKALCGLWLAHDETHFTLASLLLVWKEESIRKFCPQSEIIIEWRHDKYQINYDYKTTIRKPFLLAINEIWNLINARNIRFPFQEWFIQRQVWAYNEKSIREALINAFVHRDYRLQWWSIYIIFSPEDMTIESPWWLAWWITIENILYKKYARNRLLAEACVMIDLMEKSWQWIDDIFRESISSWKWKPIIWEDWHEVKITLPAILKDGEFVKFIQKIENEIQKILPFEAILELEQIRESGSINNLEWKNKLLDMWLIEYIWHWRWIKYILSRKYYIESWKWAQYTKLVWLDRDLKKEYILKYLKQHWKGKLKDFFWLFPELKAWDISNLLRELKSDKKIEYYWKWSKWYWKKSITSWIT